MRKHAAIISGGIAVYFAVGIWVSTQAIEWSRLGCEVATPIGFGARIAAAIFWPVPLAIVAVWHAVNWLYGVLSS